MPNTVKLKVAPLSELLSELLEQVDKLTLTSTNPDLTPLIVEKIQLEKIKQSKKKVYKLDKAYFKAEYKNVKKAIRDDYKEDKEEVKNNLVESKNPEWKDLYEEVL